MFAFEGFGDFAVLQSRFHEVWARFFSGSMKDDLRYSLSDCFDSFAFPLDYDSELQGIGEEYYAHRAELMQRDGQGMTTIYNRFHDPSETATEILALRKLHDDMDRSVLDAYVKKDSSWKSVGIRCGFGLDYLDLDDDELPDEVPEALWWPTAAEALVFAGKLPSSRRRLPWRCRWHDDTRDDVLARLLKLNAERAAEERRKGLTAEHKPKKLRNKTAGKRLTRDKHDGAGQLLMDESGSE